MALDILDFRARRKYILDVLTFWQATVVVNLLLDMELLGPHSWSLLCRSAPYGKEREHEMTNCTCYVYIVLNMVHFSYYVESFSRSRTGVNPRCNFYLTPIELCLDARQLEGSVWLLKGTYTCTRFYSSFLTFFWHYSKIEKTEVQSFTNIKNLM